MTTPDESLLVTDVSYNCKFSPDAVLPKPVVWVTLSGYSRGFLIHGQKAFSFKDTLG